MNKTLCKLTSKKVHQNILPTNIRLVSLVFISWLALAACRTADLPPAVPPETTVPPAVTEESASETTSPTSTPIPPVTPTEEVPIVVASPDADVRYVRAVYDPGSSSWTFEVTVEHPDTGWEDYADGWDVVAPDGTVLKPDLNSPFTRLLLHPHVGEQPFTRSQRGIEIPSDITEVRVRAHDLVSGFGGQEVVVDLTASSGDNFEVVR